MQIRLAGFIALDKSIFNCQPGQLAHYYVRLAFYITVSVPRVCAVFPDGENAAEEERNRTKIIVNWKKYKSQLEKHKAEKKAKK